MYTKYKICTISN